MTRSPSLFGEAARLQMDDSIRLTAAGLDAYVDTHPHWVSTWSGGKDSTCVTTLVAAMIARGMIRRPKSFSVLYADTRMELLPLAAVAADIRYDLDERGIPNRVVMADLDDRFLVYMLGRGVPPPNNGTFRWCTRKLKIDPMAHAVSEASASREGRTLLLTGVRIGESAARDQRIAVSCSKDGGECGQGRFQELPGDHDTFDPILHWRICHVWEWLDGWAPRSEWGGWHTKPLAEAYGGRDGDEAAELAARTGCVGCALVQEDRALDNVVRLPRWSYLTPMKQLRPLWSVLREPRNRLRKDGTETRKDGSLVSNPGRFGPLTLEARRWALGEVLRIQDEVNAQACGSYRPRLDFINAEEETRIRELIAARTFPDKWSGDEPRADSMIEEVHHSGEGIVVQKLLPGLIGHRS